MVKIFGGINYYITFLICLTNHRRRKKKEGDENYENVFHLVSYKWFRVTRIKTSIDFDYNMCGWDRVGRCEYLIRWNFFWGGVCVRFRGGLLVYSIHKLDYVSIFEVIFTVPHFSILPFSNISISTWGSV